MINNKWPLGIDPGGHHFVVLNVSINKKRFFVSQVVTYQTSGPHHNVYFVEECDWPLVRLSSWQQVSQSSLLIGRPVAGWSEGVSEAWSNCLR